jgi:hypothetical protein
MSKSGGCDKATRGQASLDRSKMEAKGIQNKQDYSAYSGTLHCTKGDTSNCQKQQTVTPILGKYTK